MRFRFPKIHELLALLVFLILQGNCAANEQTIEDQLLMSISNHLKGTEQKYSHIQITQTFDGEGNSDSTELPAIAAVYGFLRSVSEPKYCISQVLLYEKKTLDQQWQSVEDNKDNFLLFFPREDGLCPEFSLDEKSVDLLSIDSRIEFSLIEFVFQNKRDIFSTIKNNVESQIKKQKRTKTLLLAELDKLNDDDVTIIVFDNEYLDKACLRIGFGNFYETTIAVSAVVCEMKVGFVVRDALHAIH